MTPVIVADQVLIPLTNTDNSYMTNNQFYERQYWLSCSKLVFVFAFHFIEEIRDDGSVCSPVMDVQFG